MRGGEEDEKGKVNRFQSGVLWNWARDHRVHSSNPGMPWTDGDTGSKDM